MKDALCVGDVLYAQSTSYQYHFFDLVRIDFWWRPDETASDLNL